jgi:Sec-independent protein translocase protein TatA
VSLASLPAGSSEGILLQQLRPKGRPQAAARPGLVASTSPLSGARASTSGVHVDLSPLARTMATLGSNKAGNKRHADIDASDLPVTVKDLLKRIRDLKEKQRELQQALRQIQAGAHLKPEQQEAKLRQVQAQIQAVTAALSVVHNNLGKAIKQSNLSLDQLTQVTALALAP